MRSASFLTSSAATAKPRPCSPARAASIAALRARRLDWSAISSMAWVMAPISWIAWLNSVMVPLVKCLPTSLTGRLIFLREVRVVVVFQLLRMMSRHGDTSGFFFAHPFAIHFLFLDLTVLGSHDRGPRRKPKSRKEPGSEAGWGWGSAGSCSNMHMNSRFAPSTARWLA